MKLARSVFFDLVELLTRDHPFSRREQLRMVALSHAGILLGTLLIVWAFHLSSSPPWIFLLGEVSIIAVAVPFSVSLRGPLGDLSRFSAGPPLSQPLAAGRTVAPKEAERKKEVEELAGKVLIGLSVVQFAALASLLWETGGPIESPFAELTLIIAVFTPYIANKPKTIGIVFGASIAFYAIFIGVYTEIYPTPDTPEELRKAIEISSPAASNPPVWSYFMVNIMILIGGIAFTVFEAVLRDDERTALEAAAGSADSASGNGASEAVFPEAASGGDGDKETDAASAGNGASANGETDPDANPGSEADDDLDEDVTPA